MNTKLKRLINAHKCMLFMKVSEVLSAFKKEEKSCANFSHFEGHPDEPKCGFSKQTVGIFKDLEIDYGTFDILSDEEVSYPLSSCYGRG